MKKRVTLWVYILLAAFATTTILAAIIPIIAGVAIQGTYLVLSVGILALLLSFFFLYISLKRGE